MYVDVFPRTFVVVKPQVEVSLDSPYRSSVFGLFNTKRFCRRHTRQTVVYNSVDCILLAHRDHTGVVYLRTNALSVASDVSLGLRQVPLTQY